MLKQWEREQLRSKSQMKDASKAGVTSAEPAVTAAMDPVPTYPTVITQPPPQVPTRPQTLSTLPAVVQPHPITTFTPFPGVSQDIQPYQQANDGYLTAMLARNTVPYGPFGPGFGFPNFPVYPQNSLQHYPAAELHQPTRDNWFPTSPLPHPVPSASYHSFQHPSHPTAFPEPRHTNFREPHRTNLHEPYHSDFPESRNTGFPESHRTGFPEPHRTSLPKPCHRHAFTDHRTQVPIRPLSPEPSCDLPVQSGPTYYQGDPSQFPALQEWFSSIDNDPVRGVHGDKYSQYSHAFDFRRMKTLLDLDTIGPNQLFEQFGMSEAAARRLLIYAEEDIWSIQNSVRTPRTRT